MPDESAYPDDRLDSTLTREVNRLNDGAMPNMHLFQNDYHPVPGVVIGDVEECDFPGYGYTPASTEFASPSVTDHVAESAGLTPATFTADPSGFTSQTVYGYYLVEDGDLYDVVRFENPRVIYPYDTLDVTAVLRLANQT